MSAVTVGDGEACGEMSLSLVGTEGPLVMTSELGQIVTYDTGGQLLLSASVSSSVGVWEGAGKSWFMSPPSGKGSSSQPLGVGAIVAAVNALGDNVLASSGIDMGGNFGFTNV